MLCCCRGYTQEVFNTPVLTALFKQIIYKINVKVGSWHFVVGTYLFQLESIAFFGCWLSVGKYHAMQHDQSALFPGLDLLLVFQILNGLVSPFPALVLAPEFWLVLFPLSVFVLAQQ